MSIYDASPCTYSHVDLKHKKFRPLTSKLSHNTSEQLFSKEKREKVKTYCQEYEKDLLNKEGPGPAAFQPNLP